MKYKLTRIRYSQIKRIILLKEILRVKKGLALELGEDVCDMKTSFHLELSYRHYLLKQISSQRE
jgi:hypothetical protein